MLVRGDAKLIVEGVVPDLLHVDPVGHDAVVDRVFEDENSSFSLRLVADVAVLLVHPEHGAFMFNKLLNKSGPDKYSSFV